MIIDRILDRRDDEHDIEIGYTHARYPDGSTRELRYSPERFYHDVLEYGAIGMVSLPPVSRPSPPCGLNNANISLSMVVFPSPEGPTKATISCE